MAGAASSGSRQCQSAQNLSIATGASQMFLVLDVVNGSTANGAKVVLWYGHGSGNQRWNLVDQGDGRETIVNQNSGKCLTTDGVAGDQPYSSVDRRRARRPPRSARAVDLRQAGRPPAGRARAAES